MRLCILNYLINLELISQWKWSKYFSFTPIINVFFLWLPVTLYDVATAFPAKKHALLCLLPLVLLPFYFVSYRLNISYKMWLLHPIHFNSTRMQSICNALFYIVIVCIWMCCIYCFIAHEQYFISLTSICTLVYAYTHACAFHFQFQWSLSLRT